MNKKDFYGFTPLHHACMRGNENCVDGLLKQDKIEKEVSCLLLFVSCNYEIFVFT